jgi:hypothetical protein
MQIVARGFFGIEGMIEIRRENLRLRTILTRPRACTSVLRQTSPQQPRHRLVFFPRRHSFS